jgi:hypothetical protein
MTGEDSVVGTLGVVTVSIAKDRPGEILVKVRGGTEAYAAWADEPLSRHTQVLVVEQLSARSVRVTPFNSMPTSP